MSIRALATRKLITIKERGPAWRAALTDAGRHYLEHGAYPDGHFLTERKPDSEPAPVPEQRQRSAKKTAVVPEVDLTVAPLPRPAQSLEHQIGEEIARYCHAVLVWCHQAMQAANPRINLTGTSARTGGPAEELRYRLDAAVNAGPARLPTTEELVSDQRFELGDLWRQAARACALGEHDFDAGVGYGRLSEAECMTVIHQGTSLLPARHRPRHREPERLPDQRSTTRVAARHRPRPHRTARDPAPRPAPNACPAQATQGSRTEPPRLRGSDQPLPWRPERRDVGATWRRLGR